ncbi:Phosphate regulon sensor protein PhoR (SphS) [hydrothermal vent metagenome]|uniref:histidine kinase n=1 Tax=hydrothermal vent metagenome TaxID=652676 RepID=A0A3B0X1J5_9ZZZZ
MNVQITAGLRRELVFLAFALFLVLVLGSLMGETLGVLCAGLIAYTLWTLYNLNHLARWLSKPSKNTPETWGVWDDVYYQLYHLYRRQRKTRRKLTKMLNRFQQSTQALPYATIVLNKVDEIEWFNPAASQLFSLHQGQDVGQRIENLIRQPEFEHYISMHDFETPLEFQHHQQQILLNITPYGSGKYLLSASDITQRVKLDEMRRDFISNASHELRTPITVMSGYIEILRDMDNELFNQPLDKIYQQTQRMEKIITELIELAKLETSSVADKSQAVNMYELLDEIRTEALAFDQAKHKIEFFIENDNKAIEIYGEYNELRMAFSNLMTNAIRYTPEDGSIEFFVYTDDMGINVGVKDQGQGISYEHIPRLTERFYRVDEGRSSEKGGTGLGLAIVKQVLDRHGASLYIESTVGKGSVFRCYFPGV